MPYYIKSSNTNKTTLGIPYATLEDAVYEARIQSQNWEIPVMVVDSVGNVFYFVRKGKVYRVVEE